MTEYVSERVENVEKKENATLDCMVSLSTCLFVFVVFQRWEKLERLEWYTSSICFCTLGWNLPSHSSLIIDCNMTGTVQLLMFIDLQ